MKRSARRRSRRYQSIFRHNPRFRLLRATLLAALGAGAAGCIADPADGGDGSTIDAGAPGPETGVPPDAHQTREAGPIPMGACEDPTPILGAGDAPTGLVQCADESINRLEAVRCEPINMGRACPEEGLEGGGLCSTDADCTDRPHGRCIVFDSGPEVPSCGCQYACETDADCEDTMFCLCAGPAFGSSLCQGGNCRTHADCASGECAVIIGEGGCGLSAYSTCRQAEDTCRSYADCDYENNYEGCVNWDGALTCDELPICGRPLTVGGETRQASVQTRADWAVTLTPRMDGLSTIDRDRLGLWWQGIAALEHASVASFGRFTLELMRYGAPADLLADTQAAAGDEVLHAQLAYGLAGAFAGLSVGPGPLDLSALRLSENMAEAVDHLVREACFGESIGAAEARAMAEEATDPVVRAVCERIAEEEGRHAALAWRALQWFLEMDSGLTNVAEESLRDAITSHLAPAPGAASGIPSHGLLGDAERRNLHEATIDAVVMPCAAAIGLDLTRVQLA